MGLVIAAFTFFAVIYMSDDTPVVKKFVISPIENEWKSGVSYTTGDYVLHDGKWHQVTSTTGASSSQMPFNPDTTLAFNNINGYSEGQAVLAANNQITVATNMAGRGTDINFEALTKEYLSLVSLKNNVEIRYKTELVDLKKIDNKKWELEISSEGRKTSIRTGYVFLGAGGKTINYLQKSKIPEAKSYGGFPVSGKWLICEEKDLTEKHNSKVYGKADIGSPPMSVPHLDTRWIDNKKLLLYGPFAGFTTKFLKQGSYFDLFNSIKKNNIFSILDVGFKNNDLINYLISQSLKNHNSRVENLKNMMPSANPSDWYLKNAGQRVQIIKKTEGGGSLKFGTEIVNSSDGSLSALLGASPGASTAVLIMVEVLEKSVLFLNDKHNLQKKINDLIYPELSVSENDSTFIKEIKKRNNSIFGFHP